NVYLRANPTIVRRDDAHEPDTESEPERGHSPWLPKAQAPTAPFSATGKLFVLSSIFSPIQIPYREWGWNNATTFGTGNLVGSRKVIVTAGHVFYNKVNGNWGYTGSSGVFMPGGFRYPIPTNPPSVLDPQLSAQLESGQPIQSLPGDPVMDLRTRWQSPRG